VLYVAAGQDRFGEYRGLGVSQIAFKVTPRDSDGLLILENTFHKKGGPARHLHYILITFAPAGKMEAFFHEVTKANAMPPQDPALWRTHGMELLGPPLPLA
jgi:hypothetical protein